MTEYTLEDIKGRHVIDTQGKELGSVEDIVIDPDRWEVRSFLVSLKREVADDLHVERSAFGGARLAISRNRVQTFGEHVLLNVSTHDIANLLRQGEGGESRGGYEEASTGGGRYEGAPPPPPSRGQEPLGGRRYEEPRGREAPPPSRGREPVDPEPRYEGGGRYRDESDQRR